MEKLKVKKINPNAKLPTKATEGAAGFDLYAVENDTLPAKSRKLFSTGVAIEFPPSVVGIIKSRSSVATKKGVHVIAGVIDSDFRLAVQVALQNDSDEVFEIKAGDRIAQIIFLPYFSPSVEEVVELSETNREGGFGSTGV